MAEEDPVNHKQKSKHKGDKLSSSGTDAIVVQEAQKDAPEALKNGALKKTVLF